ncbi:hypothetical protein BJX65DRAFT_128780 [Aspergillus insuetus]
MQCQLLALWPAAAAGITRPPVRPRKDLKLVKERRSKKSGQDKATGEDTNNIPDYLGRIPSGSVIHDDFNLARIASLRSHSKMQGRNILISSLPAVQQQQHPADSRVQSPLPERCISSWPRF